MQREGMKFEGLPNYTKNLTSESYSEYPGKTELSGQTSY